MPASLPQPSKGHPGEGPRLGVGPVALGLATDSLFHALSAGIAVISYPPDSRYLFTVPSN